MDWLGKMLKLPEEFLHSNSQTTGGGVIQVGRVVKPPEEVLFRWVG